MFMLHRMKHELSALAKSIATETIEIIFHSKFRMEIVVVGIGQCRGIFMINEISIRNFECKKENDIHSVDERQI